MTSLPEILAALRAATGADREIDAAVCIAFNYVGAIDCEPKNLRLAEDEDDDKGWLWYEDDEDIPCCGDAPKLTASLDAITALIKRELPGHAISSTTCAYINGVRQDGKAGAHIMPPLSSGWTYDGYGATEALSGCIALVEAMIAMEASGNG